MENSKIPKEEPNWVLLYNGFNNGIDPSAGVGGKQPIEVDWSKMKLKTMETKRTPEEILNDVIKSNQGGLSALIWFTSATKAMEEYASQEAAAKDSRIKELEEKLKAIQDVFTRYDNDTIISRIELEDEIRFIL